MAKQCVLYNRACTGCGECDICDLDESKICDNCGRCIMGDREYNEIKIDKIIIDEKSGEADE